MSKDKEILTISELPVEEIYTSSKSTLNASGEYPYTRGIHKNMYRGRVWTMRQYAGFGTARETNERYKYLLSKGTTGLSVAFDLPTQMGRDSDSPFSLGEVGKVGVAISSIEDMRTLFKDIPLDKVSISMTINSTAAILLSFLLVLAEEQGVEWSKLKGTIQNDILKEYIARGTYIYPPKEALRIVTDIFDFCRTDVPNWNTISISGYHIREAGSTAVQELAFTLANACSYVEAALRKGLKIDDFAPRLAFFFNCHNDFLEEVSKFRAARRLWAKLMKERFGAKKEKSLMLRFHTQTAGSSLTAQQPLNNVVRTSLQAAAAVLGGTQSLHTNSYDEALGLPTEEAATLALRTQQIISEESGLKNSVDPLGGSFLIENWTDRIEAEALGLIQKIDEMGGMLKAIENNFPQDEIERAAYDYQKRIEKNEINIVGVNKYDETEGDEVKILKPDPKGEQEQVRRLASLKEKRDSKNVKALLAELNEVAIGTQNLMPVIIKCVKNNITLGEISNVLRNVFGEYS